MFRILNFPYSNSQDQKIKNAQTRQNMFQVSRKPVPNKPNNNNNNPFPTRIIHSSQSKRSYSMKNLFLNNNRFEYMNKAPNKEPEQLFMVSKKNNINFQKKQQKQAFDSDSEEISV